MRQFLREVFLQGEDSENKAAAEDVAARMRSVRTVEGKKVFTNDDIYPDFRIFQKNGRIKQEWGAP